MLSLLNWFQIMIGIVETHVNIFNG